MTYTCYNCDKEVILPNIKKLKGKYLCKNCQPVKLPRIFVLNRHKDVNGISGTGIVAEGVEFSDGQCVLRWKGWYKTISIFKNMEDLRGIHGHNEKTDVEFLERDPKDIVLDKAKKELGYEPETSIQDGIQETVRTGGI